MKPPASAGLTCLAYQLPDRRLSLGELERSGALTSDADFLHDIGFVHCHVHNGGQFEDLLVACGREVMLRSHVPASDVRWIFKYSGLGRDAEVGLATPAAVASSAPAVAQTASAPELGLLDMFRYPVARIQQQLGLGSAAAVALGQQGCGGLLSAIDLAAHVVGDGRSALCLAGDALPPHSGREVIYNVMSDAAAGVLVTADATRNRIVHFHQQSMPYYWDTPRHTQELLASYFPMAQRVVQKTLHDADMDIDDVRWVVPHNVNLRSWRILAELLGVPEERIWKKNIARVGHTVSCDHIINLCDMETEGALESGDRLLLFTFGFGANWSCLILEH